MPWENQGGGGPWGGNSGGGNGGANRPGGTPNPWGNGSGGGGRGPSGGPSGGNGNQPPSIDDILKRGRDSIPGGIPGGPIVVIAVIAILLGFWLFTGFYRVGPGEHAVIKTFGKESTVRQTPGLGWHLPEPIQSTTLVDVSKIRETKIGGRPVGRSTASPSLMLTGDENIIDIDVTLLWRVGNASNFLFKIRDPEQTVEIAAESALREVIARSSLEAALTTAKAQIQSDTETLIQSILDSYESGIEVTEVQLTRVLPPQQVQEAFDDVQNARQDRATLQNQATRDRNQLVEEARGQAQQILRGAEAYKERLVNDAIGESQRFIDVLAAYQVNPELTRKRLYLETMEEVFESRGATIIDSSLNNGTLIINGDSGSGRILPVPSGN